MVVCLRQMIVSVMTSRYCIQMVQCLQGWPATQTCFMVWWDFFIYLFVVYKNILSKFDVMCTVHHISMSW